MDGWRIRSTAISCAFASCAMLAGPGFVGTAIARADLFGFDFFGDCDKKSNQHHPRPGATVGGTPSARTTASVAAVEAPAAKIGSQPETVSAPDAAGVQSLAGVPGNVGVAEGFGGGELSRTNAAARAGNLPRVSSAPVTRSIVIRGTPRAPASVPSVPLQAPAVVPLAALPPVSPEPETQQAPAAPPVPSPSASHAKGFLGHSDSGVTQISDSYRAGYTEYLRAATTSDLIAAAAPGVAGIAGFTLVGAYVGYRQARALRRALLAPVPTSVLL